MSATIRPLSLKDEDKWLDLWQGYIDFYEVDLASEVTETLWRRLHDTETPVHGLVALDENQEVIGLLHYVIHLNTWGIAPICYLEDLYVAHDTRGNGAGRALIEALAQKAKEEAWGRLYWMTDSKNSQARKLYDKLAKLTDFVRYVYPL